MGYYYYFFRVDTFTYLTVRVMTDLLKKTKELANMDKCITCSSGDGVSLSVI